MSEAEKWKKIPGLSYEASTIGRIRSATGKICKPSKSDKRGYLKVSIKISTNNWNNQYVHRLVALAFLKNPNNLTDINHLNGVKDDNRIKNLEWATRSENVAHSFRVLGRKVAMRGVIGKDHPLSKKVKQMDLNGNLVNVWDSLSDCTRSGYNRFNIHSVCIGKRKTHKGFKWQMI